MRRIDAATFCTTASSEPRAALTTRVDKMSIKSIIYILSGALLGLLLLVSVPARAGLFDDEGARRQIVELQRQIDANAKGLQGLQPRLERVEASITERVLDLSQLIDGMRQDMARLRGTLELLSGQVEQLERRQKDLYVDLDSRLRKMEEQQNQLNEKITAPEREAAKEKDSYEAALNQFKVGNYQSAIASFQTFMANFANSSLVPAAQYWVGNAYYSLRDYKAAIAAQQKLASTWPDNAKAPDALLNIASSQAELGDSKSARETLRNLVNKYGSSPAAEAARQRLRR